MAKPAGLESIDFCIRDRNKVPSGGFYFVTPNATAIRSANWEGLHVQVKRWYKANDVTLPDEIDAQIDVQICERAPTEYCLPCNETPGIPAQAVSMAREVWRWIVVDGAKVDMDLYKKRKEICAGTEDGSRPRCQFWNGEARMGYGRCAVCGCGQLKLFMPSATCRKGKW